MSTDSTPPQASSRASLPQASLRGRLALVTGASRGIGAAIADALEREGARVVRHGHSPASNVRGDADFVAADLRDLDAVDVLAEQAASLLGGLDILVNNAGVELNATVEELDPQQVSEQLTVNFQAPVRLTQRLLPTLRASAHASIVNVTSIHDTVPSFANSIYCATKAALEMFSRTLAIEVGPLGVRVNCLAPGAIETDINREILDQIGRDHFRAWIPLGRVGSTDEIADAAVFLASDASRYMTGATLTIDGGYSQHLVRYRMQH